MQETSITTVTPNWAILFLLVPIVLLPLLGTVLGGIAVARIHQSKGQLTGMGWAVFATLVTPTVLLLAVGCFLIALFGRAIRTSDSMASHELLAMTGILLILLNLAATIKVVRALARKLRGTKSLHASLLSKRTLIQAIPVVIIGLGLGILFWLERPVRFGGDPIVAESPDQMYQAQASTWHRMRIFGPDVLTYRFRIQGRGGSEYLEKEILVPIDKLASDYLASPLSDYSFSDHGTIQWLPDTRSFSFRVKGVQVERQSVD